LTGVVRRLLWVLAAVGVAAVTGCAGPDRPFLAPADIGPAAGATEPSGSAPEPVRALVTPTGITVAVLEEQPDGYRVRTPCGGEALVAWGTPLYRADVVIDPGHGGPRDSGAVGPNGLTERDLNLDLARSLATEVTRRGFTVALTRSGDHQVPLVVRAELADRLEADALISIHHNGPSARPSQRPGTEVYVQDGVDASRRLGGLIHQHVMAALSRFDVAWTAAADAGVLVVRKDSGEESYGMIRYPATPAVLAELAYLTNPPEAELLATAEYRLAVTAAMADAVEAFFGSDDQGAGFVDQPRTFTPSGATGGVGGCEEPALQ
jgi:N-acetylmuramoyl-L-alanine amidase